MEPWAELLELPSDRSGRDHTLPGMPGWRYWAGLFAYLASVADWSVRAQSARDGREHVMASEAREIVKRHARVLEMEGVPLPAMDRYRGKEAATGLLDATRALADWMGVAR